MESSNNVENKRTNEQWKDYGDCMICRRKPYCKTVCRAHKRFMFLWRQVFARKMAHEKA